MIRPDWFYLLRQFTVLDIEKVKEKLLATSNVLKNVYEVGFSEKLADFLAISPKE